MKINGEEVDTDSKPAKVTITTVIAKQDEAEKKPDGSISAKELTARAEQAANAPANSFKIETIDPNDYS